MDRAFRLLSRSARGVAARGAARFGLALGLAAAGCGSGGECQFDFARDAVTYDRTPWICAAGGPTLEIAFFPDGTGSWTAGGNFLWATTSCRSLALEPAGGGAAVELSELGGNVAVGRLTFVVGGRTYLCGYGVPPP